MGAEFSFHYGICYGNIALSHTFFAFFVVVVVVVGGILLCWKFGKFVARISATFRSHFTMKFEI